MTFMDLQRTSAQEPQAPRFLQAPFGVEQRNIYIYIYIYIYRYVCMYICICIYVYVYTTCLGFVQANKYTPRALFWAYWPVPSFGLL